ncbi:hypothetical protein ACJMK2_032995 [Sinanodonta woodiana]|uniref:C-type lectin domain-containing protein n=1 Tax=Sinanodonta woodiana TaxID=1069815 RepID=A0ABD3X3G1_SINWO
MNWYDARATCHRNGGDLLVPPDYQTEQNLWELIPCHTEKNRAWIGVSDTAKPGQWMSIDNSSLRFQHWNTYPIPILQAGQSCAVADPVNNLGWDTELCTSSFTFVCNRTLGSCPNGWLSHGDRCYQVIDVPASRKTYFDALQYCSQRGTSLLVINSADEQKYILQTLTDLHITRAWLAFSVGISDNSSYIASQHDAG